MNPIPPFSTECPEVLFGNKTDGPWPENTYGHNVQKADMAEACNHLAVWENWAVYSKLRTSYENSIRGNDEKPATRGENHMKLYCGMGNAAYPTGRQASQCVEVKQDLQP